MPGKIVPDRFKFYLIDLLRGTSIMKALNELHAQQYLPASELEVIRRSRLENLFKLAKTSVPYYRNFNSYEELPVLSKVEVIEHFNDFFSTPTKSGLSKKTTGGSTGVPFAYYTTRQSVSYMWAGIILSWEMTGYRPGEKVIFLAGSSLYKNDWKHKLFYKLLNVDVLYASPLSDEIMEQYARTIREKKTTVLYGYSYAINTLAKYLNRVGKNVFPHLKAFSIFALAASVSSSAVHTIPFK